MLLSDRRHAFAAVSDVHAGAKFTAAVIYFLQMTLRSENNLLRLGSNLPALVTSCIYKATFSGKSVYGKIQNMRLLQDKEAISGLDTFSSQTKRQMDDYY